MAVDDTAVNVVAVGASAGGVEALTGFVAGLPEDLPYAVLVVMHLPVGAPSVLAQILDRKGPLPASQAVDGEPLRTSAIRVAVPDRHVLVHDRRTVLSEGPTENGHRPAVNSLFRSVALEFGRRAVSVVLSGVLDDGTLGSAAIRMRGGTTIAQAPTDALFPAMPLNAIQAGVVDHELPAIEIGGLLQKLAGRDFDDRQTRPDLRMELENHIAMAGRFSATFDTEDLGAPTGYSCPDCNGGLISVSAGNYRCHVGHAWTADALLGARDQETEGALWVAMRSLQEKARLSRRLAAQVKPGILREKYDALADEAERARSVIGDRLTHAYSRHRKPDD